MEERELEKLAEELYKEYEEEFRVGYGETLTEEQLNKKIGSPSYSKWLESKGYNDEDDLEMVQLFEMGFMDNFLDFNDSPSYIEERIGEGQFNDFGALTEVDLNKVLMGECIGKGIRVSKGRPNKTKKVDTGVMEYEIDLVVGNKKYLLTYQEVDNGWEEYYIFNEYPKLQGG